MARIEELHGVAAALLCAWGLMVSVPAAAADSGWYVGLGAGASDVEGSGSDLDRELAQVGITANSSFDDTDSGWKVYGGYDFNRHFGVEASYVDFGEFDFTSRVTAPVAVTVTGSEEIDGFGIAAVGKLPVTDRFRVHGKVGAFNWDAGADAYGVVGGRVARSSADSNGTDFMFGVGAGFDFTDHFGVRAEWERFNDVDGADLDFVSASLQFHF